MINIIKSEKLCKIVKFLKCIYLCLFTFYIVSREIILLNSIIGNILVTGSFMGMAVLFIGYDLLTKRFCLKTRYFPAAVLFLAVTIISCIINYKYGIFSNLKGVASFIIYFFLLYPEAFSDKNERVLSSCMNTAFFTLGIYSAFSIPMYFYNLYHYAAGEQPQGYSPNSSRLWGLYQDPNYLALYSLLAIIVSVYLFASSKSIIMKIFYVIVDIIHLVALAMSGSRMGIVCFIAALFWISAVTCVSILHYKLWKRIVIFIFAAALSVILPFTSVKLINNSMPEVKKTILHAGTAEQYINIRKFYNSLYTTFRVKGGLQKPDLNIENYPFDEEKSSLNRVDENPGDMSNGRIDRWLDGLKLLAEKPFFGISPRNIFSFADNTDVETSMGENDFNIHNTYLEILAGAGIVGGAFVLGFLLLAAFFILKTIFKTTPDIKTLICTAQIVMIVLSAILLPDIIFFQLTFAGFTFWLGLGHCLNTNQENYKNSLSYKLINKCFKRKTDI